MNYWVIFVFVSSHRHQTMLLLSRDLYAFCHAFTLAEPRPASTLFLLVPYHDLTLLHSLLTPHSCFRSMLHSPTIYSWSRSCVHANVCSSSPMIPQSFYLPFCIASSCLLSVGLDGSYVPSGPARSLSLYNRRNSHWSPPIRPWRGVNEPTKWRPWKQPKLGYEGWRHDTTRDAGGFISSLPCDAATALTITLLSPFASTLFHYIPKIVRQYYIIYFYH